MVEFPISYRNATITKTSAQVGSVALIRSIAYPGISDEEWVAKAKKWIDERFGEVLPPPAIEPEKPVEVPEFKVCDTLYAINWAGYKWQPVHIDFIDRERVVLSHPLGSAEWSRTTFDEAIRVGSLRKVAPEPPEPIKPKPTPTIPEIPEEFEQLPEPVRSLAIDLKKAVEAKDKAKIIELMRKLLEIELSPIPALIPVILKIGIPALITALGTIGFAKFLNEEAIQTIDLGIYQAQQTKDWDLVKKGLERKKSLLDFVNNQLLPQLIPFVNIFIAVDNFMKAAQTKYEIDREIMLRETGVMFEPEPGDFEACVKAVEEGKDPIPFTPNSTSLIINSVPSGAGVEVSEPIAMSTFTPAIFSSIKPGTYTIKVFMEGYETEVRTINVRRNERNVVNVFLRKLPEPEKASIEVVSVPDKADIYLNDKLYKFPTNTVIEGLEPGTYRVYVKKTGYKDSEVITLTLGPGERGRAFFTLEELVLPEPEFGSLVITTAPPGARVFIGKEDKGKTDEKGRLDLLLRSGIYDLTFSLPGYKTVTRTVLIKPGITSELRVTLSPIEEKRKLWRIDVSAVDPLGNPLAAKILVNNSFTGKFTPDYVLLLPGTYIIRVEKAGYLPAEEEITLEALV